MPEVVRNIFENYVKDRFDLKDCIAVNNGTSALIAPLWSLDLQPGDEVITTKLWFPTHKLADLLLHAYNAQTEALGAVGHSTWVGNPQPVSVPQTS